MREEDNIEKEGLQERYVPTVFLPVSQWSVGHPAEGHSSYKRLNRLQEPCRRYASDRSECGGNSRDFSGNPLFLCRILRQIWSKQMYVS